jgi:hypothetical protein
MAINYEALRQFARKNGDVRLFAPNKGEVVILKDGTPDLFDVIDRATVFTFDGRSYTREDFEKLMAPK